MASSDLVVDNFATSSFEKDEVPKTSHFPYVYVNDVILTRACIMVTATQNPHADGQKGSAGIKDLPGSAARN